MPKCSFCEYEIALPEGAGAQELECPCCGRPIALHADEGELLSPAAETLILVEIATGKSLSLPLGQAIILGREACGSELLQNRKFSRKHCLIETCPEALSICDLGSLNGTFVNGIRISIKTPLKPEDIITLADSAFAIRLGMIEVEASQLQQSPPEKAKATEQICANCGYRDTGGLPRCPECGFGWN